MYFLFFILPGWRKRSAVQPQTMDSEFPCYYFTIPSESQCSKGYFPGISRGSGKNPEKSEGFSFLLWVLPKNQVCNFHKFASPLKFFM